MRDVLGGLLAQFHRELVCDSAEIVIDGDLAFDRGSFSQSLREKETGMVVRERGHYLWLYVRRAEGWKLARVIWNGGEDMQDVAFDVGRRRGGQHPMSDRLGTNACVALALVLAALAAGALPAAQAAIRSGGACGRRAAVRVRRRHPRVGSGTLSPDQGGRRRDAPVGGRAI